ncbi:hypothetical protein [Bifidobacterium boum]|nr:hypothetical protein [Bifidobacterium boum]
MDIPDTHGQYRPTGNRLPMLDGQNRSPSASADADGRLSVGRS